MDYCEAAQRAASVLRKPGAVILVPTETVYGLVCRAQDKTACARIFELKQRPESKLIGWFVSGSSMLKKHGVIINTSAEKLLEKYTPGALTLISNTAAGDTQGYRVPDHPLLQAILAEVDEPLAQTSANSSGNPDARSFDEAITQLHGEVDWFFDGGALDASACASTVVDTTCQPIKILRQGSIEIDDALKNL